MNLKTTSTAMICLVMLAACEPGNRVSAETDPLGAGDTAVPADQALAAMCSGDAGQQAAMADAVNAARAAQGKIVLAPNAKLNQIAQSHACDVAAMGRATVAGSNGSNVVDRARAVDYPTCGVAQLVSIGGSPSGVVAGWLGSEPHRVELLGQSSDEVGAGAARGPDGRLWWSVVLGDDCA